MALKVYTQAEFDALPRDEYGWKNCPTGDYTQVKEFDAGCRFGECCRFDARCSFGECCSFGEECRFDARCSFGKCCSHEGLTNSVYFACDRIGSERRKTYFFRADEGYFVRAGCFFGTFDAFVERVKEVHAGTRYEREYLAAVELAKIVLSTEE